MTFLVLSRAPLPVALLRFPNVREKEKGLKPQFHGPTYDASFSIHRNYFANPNGEDMWKWIANLISNFYDNPTVNESGIVVLPRVLGFSEKRKVYDVKCISLSSDMISKFPLIKSLGIELWTGCLNFMTIQWWMSLRLSFFWDRFASQREKRRFCEKEKGKRNWEVETTFLLWKEFF